MDGVGVRIASIGRELRDARAGLRSPIAVLVDPVQLNGAAADDNFEKRVPGCMHLKILAFNRLCHCWRSRALNKLSHIAEPRCDEQKRAQRSSPVGPLGGLWPQRRWRRH